MLHKNKLSQNDLKSDKFIALAGNPNVGKSTIFNGLTGMNQHTGNWAGKTVGNAFGHVKGSKKSYTFVDIPGTYSLMANSKEEQVARRYLCFGDCDAVLIVCDATCIERNLNLVLQTMEIHKNVLVCVNLLDEAKRKGIDIDLDLLSKRLGTVCLGTTAKDKKSLSKIIKTVDEFFEQDRNNSFLNIIYDETVEKAVSILQSEIEKLDYKNLNPRWLSIKILEGDMSLIDEISDYLGIDFPFNGNIINAIKKANKILASDNLLGEKFKDKIVSSIINFAEFICNGIVTITPKKSANLDLKIDKILTSKTFGYPIMFAFLLAILWLTIVGANYPSNLLFNSFVFLQDKLINLSIYLRLPEWLYSALILGVFRVLSWVVAVMLPPMTIFFPLFTLLEDVGFLPRVAYNLDSPFKKCNACGKQALTMCMGFGCNAVGVTGCRIIDSKRERLIAILTNCFVPCNGRFPSLIAIITMFFVGSSLGIFSSLFSAGLLAITILLGILFTFIASKFLSKTLLKGEPSSFTLELPSYRKPQILKVIVRSIFDRTLYVLKRAIIVSAPAGLIIWLFANIQTNQQTILEIVSNFLDPIARVFGLDGVILLSFILGFPANEIVIPIIIMTYLSSGTILEYENLTALKTLFVDNGWTITTAICFIIFSLFHWPCSTTILTIKGETNSIKWTIISAFLPTVIGLSLCFLINLISTVLT